MRQDTIDKLNNGWQLPKDYSFVKNGYYKGSSVNPDYSIMLDAQNIFHGVKTLPEGYSIKKNWYYGYWIGKIKQPENN